MTSIDISGEAAEVRWAWHQAAALGAWTIAAQGDGLQVTATIVSADEFRVSQAPLTFAVPRGEQPAWTWPIEPNTLQITGSTLTARLGS